MKLKSLKSKPIMLLRQFSGGASGSQPSTPVPAQNHPQVSRSRLTNTGDGRPVESKIHGRALLIGCNHGGLLGTKNDVDDMATILEDLNTHEFEITKLTGCRAIARHIRDEWKKLIQSTEEGDAVVIYYSGHGGRAEISTQGLEEGQPNKFQYLVPHNFDEDDSPKEWKGILDIEISRWLHDITEKTGNVTYILDCCHSSALGKDPTGPGVEKAVAKFKSTQLMAKTFIDIWTRAKKSCMEGMPDGDNAGVRFTQADYQNPKVVRICAAAAEGSAWQFHDSRNWRGAMTSSLGGVFQSLGRNRSWLNIMAAVGESMKLDSDSKLGLQQPRSAGADDRIPFLLDIDPVTELWAGIPCGTGRGIIIQGGMSIGTKAGDIYELQPIPKKSDPPGGFQPLKVKIDCVYGLSATAEVAPQDNAIKPQEGRVAFATLVERRKPRRIKLQGKINDQIKQRINDSKLFQLIEVSQVGNLANQGGEAQGVAGSPQMDGENLKLKLESVLSLKQDNETITLYGHARYSNASRPGVPLVSFSIQGGDLDGGINRLFMHAERFARSLDVVSLKTGRDEEEFNPDVFLDIFRDDPDNPIVTTDTSEKSAKRETHSGPTRTTENAHNGVHATLLVVDAVGEITILSVSQGERGINLTSMAPNAAIGKGPPLGVQLVLPDIPGPGPGPTTVCQHFVLVVTAKEIDLRYLQPRRANYIRDAVAKGDRSPEAFDVFGRSNRYRSTAVPYSFLLKPTEG
ncbi:hypothetical protein O1611_g8258 [Lasiodiplodia mahajangana]|uniref:Uncharacterized protein n=1 Tax=Lasiodiplodia mahajangana TaxID=1108764 RepID=A0ACC2JD57_9PEZI|nr:hypothetical protein O1611_g8258 [Lasiodiplodia mahajangana]